MPLSLSIKSPKSTITLEFSRSKSFSLSRKAKRANTYPSPLTPSDLSDAEPFDLSIILNSKNFDSLDIVKDVDNKENRDKSNMQVGKIKFQLNDKPTSKDRMTAKLIKNRKMVVGEGQKNPSSCVTKDKTEINQLLPSPVIHSTFPKSPYPFNGFNEPTLLPISRDRKQAHRRSRSFSESITSSTSITQPWRDRETWLAIHTPKPSSLTQRNGSIPIELEDGGWRARGVGTFFGADMNGPYPSLKVRVKPLSPPLSPDEHNPKKNPYIGHPGDTEETWPSPAEETSKAINSMIHLHKSHSAWNVSRNDLAEDFSSSQHHTHFPVENDDDDDDFLPPLLPRTITRTSSFSSSSRNTTPIPWAQRCASSSGTNSPGRQTPPSTPSRQRAKNTPQSSSPLNKTPETWTKADPSPPRKSPRESSVSPSDTPRTPETPTRNMRLPFGKKINRGHDASFASTSPRSISVLDEQMTEHSQVVQQISPAKKIWKALKLTSPGKKDEQKNHRRG
ncbi:uncharacterized protein I206_104197 [Kwoniella pini CBS 10737]|uniref:Uncharacterized protein n=1 Tax=Kwoniella pini CBS 10737 TaxID=1296096 RepID=A0A1B9I2F8_9TREE|nr:uncharacterized protein I206_04228 [Kwoniella pini CBS 10737]OCF49704.1 hypothetical protein I206_04228 [Kwoniella pini CBS 10737]